MAITECNKLNRVVLLDSLMKRINFLNEVIENEHINNVETIHGRVEDIGQDNRYREQFDIATSRAVAPLNVLVEYLIPLVKVDGIVICMKGPKLEEELEEAKNAIIKLGGKIEQIEETKINNEITRNTLIIRKIKPTDKMFPRKAGLPSKKPIK